MKIIYTTRFKRSYKKLPVSVKNDAEKRETIFRKNPFDHRLKTHKLKGRLSDFWSFSVSYKHRIVFEFDTKNKSTIYFYDVGDHDVYQ